MSFRAATTRSRRRWNASTISWIAGALSGDCSASIAPHWLYGGIDAKKLIASLRWTWASSAVGYTAQPTRPPVHAYVLEHPEAMMVRASMPGIDAIDTCSSPSKVIASYDSSEKTRTFGPVFSSMTSESSASCVRVATPPVGLDGKFRKIRPVFSLSSGSSAARERPKPSSSLSTTGTGLHRKYATKDSKSGYPGDG